MATDALNKHLGFLDQLDTALKSALDYYSSAGEESVEELRQLQREVHRAQRSVLGVIAGEENGVQSETAGQREPVAASSR